MPKRSRSAPADPNANAFRIVALATAEKPPHKKDRAAVSLGRKGGKKGGPARAKALTAEQRRAIAVAAAEARWGKRRGA